MHLKIISPQNLVFEGSVDALIAPAPDGSFELLKNHAPLISALVEGDLIVILPSTERKVFPIKGGFLETKENKTIILID